MTEISELRAAAQRLGENFGPAIATALISAGFVGADYAPLIAMAQGLAGYWGALGRDRTLDLLQEFINNKEAIIEEVIKTERFQSVFVNIISKNITESNERKRQFLKNYILNLACGLERDFNEHTKLLNTLDTITLEQVDLLLLWKPGSVIDQWKRSRPTMGSIDRHALIAILAEYRQKGGVTSIDPSDSNSDKINQLLLSLGYHDLLYALGPDNFGSSVEAKVKGITNFGKVFLDFIQR